jgi:hypothetical protein
MAKTENASSDYTTLSEMSEPVTFFAKIIERSERFTVVRTTAALYTIPNDGIISVSQFKGVEDEEISKIRVRQDAKIVQQRLVSAAQIAGFWKVTTVRRPLGETDCECPAQCCEQCTQCCMLDPASAAIASATFRKALR